MLGKYDFFSLVTCKKETNLILPTSPMVNKDNLISSDTQSQSTLYLNKIIHETNTEHSTEQGTGTIQKDTNLETNTINLSNTKLHDSPKLQFIKDTNITNNNIQDLNPWKNTIYANILSTEQINICASDNKSSVSNVLAHNNTYQESSDVSEFSCSDSITYSTSEFSDSASESSDTYDNSSKFEDIEYHKRFNNNIIYITAGIVSVLTLLILSRTLLI